MKNNSWRMGVVLAGVFVAGALLMHWWDSSRAEATWNEPAPAEVVDSFPEGDSPSDLPPQPEAKEEPAEENQNPEASHLSTIDVSDIKTIVFYSGEEFSPQSMREEGAPAVFLPSITIKPNQEEADAQQVVEQTQDDGNRMSMISVPVSVKTINSLEEYRAFKRSARGSYPTVDFKKQQILVLESGSNLPDKVFEIVSLEEVDGKRLLSYRVNVFGLEKKINTHSVIAVNKKDMPLELKQVL